jgi:hypothetical protein
LRERVGESPSAGSSEETWACDESVCDASAADDGTFSGACSNVASETLAAELHRLAQVALRALDAGEIALARELLRALVGAGRQETTGCDAEIEE